MSERSELLKRHRRCKKVRDDWYDPLEMRLVEILLAENKDLRRKYNLVNCFADSQCELLLAQLAATQKQFESALNDLVESGTNSNDICGYCTHDGRCPIPDDEMDNEWPDCFEWRGPQEESEDNDGK